MATAAKGTSFTQLQAAAAAREQRPRLPARMTIIALIAIVAAGAFAYANSLAGPFVFDDENAIEKNPTIRQLWSVRQVLTPPRDSTLGGRPVVNLSFAINYAVFGGDVRGYHATNVAIHLLTSLALFGVLRRTLRLPRLRARFGPRADGLALACTLLWEAHPLLTEVVTYTSTRTEGLMALFFVLTFYAFVRALTSEHPRWWYAMAIVASAIGMGCKEVMATAPVLVYLFDATVVSGTFIDPLRRRWKFYVPLVATIAIVPALLLTVDFTAKTGEGFQRIKPLAYAMTQTGVIVHYLRLAFWPTPLVVDYADWPIARSLRDVAPQAAGALVLLIVTAWGVIRRRPWGFLLAWVLVILAPTSSFIPLATEVASERRMFLPLVAIVVGVVLLADRGIAKVGSGRSGRYGRAIGMVAATTLVIVLAYATRWRNADYSSKLLLWSDTVAKRPNNSRALRALGETLRVDGALLDARRVYQRLVDLNPADPRAQLTLGDLLIGEGDLDEALVHLNEAVRRDPKNAAAHASLGLALARRGDAESASREYRAALAVDPNNVDAHVYLSDLLAAAGDKAQAILHLKAALRGAPNDLEIQQKLKSLQSSSPPPARP